MEREKEKIKRLSKRKPERNWCGRNRGTHL